MIFKSLNGNLLQGFFSSKENMKINFNKFWENGYIYTATICLLYVIYALNGRVGIYDWAKEISYFQYIKTSLGSYHSLPFFWWSKIESVSSYPAVAHTSNFISNPETLLFSPFIPFICFMNTVAYVKFLSVIHFFIGLTGLFLLRKRLQWNNLQFRVFLILFLFSPVIFQHLSIGYTPWLNLFFFPWLVYFLADKKHVNKIIAISIILSFILLQGGTHVFVWFAVFIFLYSFFCAYFEKKWQYLFHMLIIISMVLLLAYIRIYATATTYSDFHQDFSPGYNPINFIFWALVPSFLIPPVDILFKKIILFGIPSWDGGIFWGMSLLMLVVMIFNYKSFNSSSASLNEKQLAQLNYHSIFITSAVLFFFSFFSVYEVFIKIINWIIYVPFLDGVEKYPFRFAIPAFMGFSLVISFYAENIWERMDEWIRKKKYLLGFFSILTDKMPIFSFLVLLLSGLCLGISVLSSNRIQEYLNMIITAAYNGTGYLWLTSLMKGKNNISLEYYLSYLETMYWQLQTGLIIIFVLSTMAFIVLKIHKKYQSVFKGLPYWKYEMILSLPLLFSSIMWLVVAISTPMDHYPLQDVSPPKITIIPQIDKNKLKIITSPQKLIINQAEYSNVKKYVFPEIKASDSKFFDITTKNADMVETDGFFSIKPFNSDPIELTFITKNYMQALGVTIVAWLSVISFLIIQLLLGYQGARKNINPKE